MVMDFGMGGDLSKLIKRERMMSEYQVRIYSAQIALALDYLHYHDIVYRDLKPSNVVIDEKSNCKLIDFGLSKTNI